MDFMKVLDQTFREIKREVNLKVLKVPEIEQKVLDATNDEPWGPHGSALTEIAEATKKFTESQIVMNAIWSRLGETERNWRRVYKALAVIEHLIAHGSERAVDDIVEHTFQISSLSSFKQAEPNGKDTGFNVRKKAETIIALLNDKEKIQEARDRAVTNKDKYVGLSSLGGTYKSSSSSSVIPSGGNNKVKQTRVKSSNDVSKRKKEHADSSSSLMSNASKNTSTKHDDNEADDFNPRGVPADPTVSSETWDPFNVNLFGNVDFSHVSLENRTVDPFEHVPDGDDLFGEFSSSTGAEITTAAAAATATTVVATTTAAAVAASREKPATASSEGKEKVGEKFHVKSEIWADSISRGLIDLNITADPSSRNPPLPEFDDFTLHFK